MARGAAAGDAGKFGVGFFGKAVVFVVAVEKRGNVFFFRFGIKGPAGNIF